MSTDGDIVVGYNLELGRNVSGGLVMIFGNDDGEEVGVEFADAEALIAFRDSFVAAIDTFLGNGGTA